MNCKDITCKSCGSNDFKKSDPILECNHCGTGSTLDFDSSNPCSNQGRSSW